MFATATKEREWFELADLARRIASRYVPSDFAEDISQKVCLQVSVSDPPGETRPFVSTLARRLALDNHTGGSLVEPPVQNVRREEGSRRP